MTGAVEPAGDGAVAGNVAIGGFIAELRARPEVVGALLFGSWARGDHQAGSDVDLVVIVEAGYARSVEYRGAQAFEILYVTAQDALAYWRAHPDNAAALWAVAQILHDRDGTMRGLATQAAELLAAGKPRWNAAQIAHARFDTDDLLRHVTQVASSDPETANLLLTNKVMALTGLYFDLRTAWTPPPKQRLARLAAHDHELAALVRRFYAAPTVAQLALVTEVVRRVFALG